MEDKKNMEYLRDQANDYKPGGIPTKEEVMGNVDKLDPEELKQLFTEIKQTVEANRERYGTKREKSRTQWANLVVEYGFEKVCHYEKLTPAQLRKILNGSFSDQLKEKFRQNRLKK